MLVSLLGTHRTALLKIVVYRALKETSFVTHFL
jgi:hypothetical protein